VTEKKYLAAQINMLNREDQTEKTFMAYPITRVVLLGELTPENLNGSIGSRTFFVGRDGAWAELQHFYVHHNGACVLVKEAEFFRFQGGLTAQWGKAWRGPIEAESIEDARKKGEEIFKRV
jgi:hypothetical protein